MARTSKNRKRKRRRQASVSSVAPRSYSGEIARSLAVPEVAAERESSSPDTPPNRDVPAPADSASLRGSEAVDWHQEYAQVLADLRYLLLVTAALFALMIVLGYTL